jgi:hypothetical protein
MSPDSSVIPTELARLAYERVKADNAWRVFYRHPFEIDLVDVSPNDWVHEVEALVDSAQYVAEPAPPLEVPKPNWHVRPGLALSLRDQVAYSYAGLRAAPVIAPLLDWSAYTVRFSYRLANAGKQWFEREFQGWRNFDHVSLGKLAGHAKYVVVSDISGYYENIDIGRLVSELAALRVEKPARDQLGRLWNKWAGPRGRGIPQACAPSHVFGEFYLDPVDRSLRASGIDHLRYLDDIRIFTASAREARLQLQELSRLLRDRGLNLQSAKTDVLEASKARVLFSSVRKCVSRVSRKMALELALLGRAGEYADPEEIRRILLTDPNDPPPEVVERAWGSFVAGEFGDFDKTVLHYLLRRLADIRSPEAVGWCLQCLVDRPEETPHVLRYLGDVQAKLSNHALSRLAALLSGDEIIYDYQLYLLLRLFYERRLPEPIVLEYARRRVGVTASPLLRPHAVAYLGDHGDETDLVRLSRVLQEDVSSLGRATLLLGLRRDPGPIKNLWYGRCVGESAMVDRAIRLARTSS